MNPIPDRLSIWELAHRWHDAIPSSSDDSSVTREIRDTLLALVDGVLYHGINVYLFTTRGLDVIRRSAVAGPLCEVPSEIAAEDFEDMFETGVLDRKVLQNYSLMLEDVFEWCVHEGFEPPDFAIPEWAYGKLTPEPESGRKGAARCRGQGEVSGNRSQEMERESANPNSTDGGGSRHTQ